MSSCVHHLDHKIIRRSKVPLGLPVRRSGREDEGDGRHKLHLLGNGQYP